MCQQSSVTLFNGRFDNPSMINNDVVAAEELLLAWAECKQ